MPDTTHTPTQSPANSSVRDDVERALRESEERFRLLSNASPVGIYVCGLDGAMTYANPRMREMWSVSEAESNVRAMVWTDRIHPDDREATTASWWSVLQGGREYEREFRIVRPDGALRWMRGRAAAMKDASGRATGLVGTLEDVTEQREAEDARRYLAEASALLNSSLDLDALVDGLARLALTRFGDGCIVDLVDGSRVDRRGVLRVSTPERDAIVQRYIARSQPLGAHSIGRAVLESGRARLVGEVTDALIEAITNDREQAEILRDTRARSVLVVPIMARHRGIGVLTFFSFQGSAPLDETDVALATELGARAGLAIENARLYQGLRGELEEHRRTEAALRESRARLEEAQRIGRIASWTWESATGETTVSPGMYALLDADPIMFVPGVDSFAACVHPDDRETLYSSLQQAFEQRLPYAESELRLVRRDGSVRLAFARTEFRFMPDGRLSSGSGTLQDVTERRKLEEQFRQAQKMEAVGRLASGIAHDFNNLLTVIASCADLARASIDRDGAGSATAVEEVDEIRRAAQRAAALTSQLLAFSRRQVAQPRVIEPNSVVRNAERMLRRLLGEDVEVQTRLATTRLVRIDPGQLEQVLVNLAVNARDAMPEGGRLVLITSDAEVEALHPSSRLAPGRYVALAVSDTGTGMGHEVRARIFEPFFTTKGPGTGTGLGLSTVFGIVTQAGGEVVVDSEPGVGSTFMVYLPAMEGREDPSVPPAVEIRPPNELRGDETLLLVEDDETVRKLLARALTANGYRVLAAADGPAALAMAAQHGEAAIDLVVSDLVLPGFGGRVLLDRLRAVRPSVAALLVSGYGADERARKSLARDRVGFLEKPFTVDELTAAVRAALDARVNR